VTSPAAVDGALEFHPLAQIFPLLEGAEFDELVADVRAHGVREPVWLYEGKILDGRNRYRVAKAAGVPCPTRVYEGEDPVGFVISLNLKRRHLNESQRAMVATKLATLPRGANQWRTGQLAAPPTQAKAAALLNVGERSVRRAAEVRDHGVSELKRAVERGDISVAAAADVATESPERQREIVARGEQQILKVAKDIRARKTEQRRIVRVAQLTEIAKGNTALPTGVRYPIVAADPAWRYEGWNSDEATYDRGPRYPTMPLEEICALPVPDLATEIALLLLWVPSAHLKQAFEVIGAWGFSHYCGESVWVKTDPDSPDVIKLDPAPGLGHWQRNQHESLLIARRGDFPQPPPHLRLPSVFFAPRRGHSVKPDEPYARIERLYPELPKIELFARARRPGWEAWGNQLPESAQTAPQSSDGLDIPEFLRRTGKRNSS
jgi:N6-adenosine-specific RNA methylase IME4